MKLSLYGNCATIFQSDFIIACEQSAVRNYEWPKLPTKALPPFLHWPTPHYTEKSISEMGLLHKINNSRSFGRFFSIDTNNKVRFLIWTKCSGYNNIGSRLHVMVITGLKGETMKINAIRLINSITKLLSLLCWTVSLFQYIYSNISDVIDVKEKKLKSSLHQSCTSVELNSTMLGNKYFRTSKCQSQKNYKNYLFPICPIIQQNFNNKVSNTVIIQ